VAQSLPSSLARASRYILYCLTLIRSLSRIRVFFIFFFNFLVMKFYFQSSLHHLFKPRFRLEMREPRFGERGVRSGIEGFGSFERLGSAPAGALW
jgi:hypothetical protein